MKVDFELLRTGVCLHNWMSYPRKRRICALHLHLALMRRVGMSVPLSACLPCHLCCSHRYRTDPGHRITKRSLWGTFRWSTEHGHYDMNPLKPGFTACNIGFNSLKKLSKSIFVFCTDLGIKNNYLFTGEGITTVKNRTWFVSRSPGNKDKINRFFLLALQIIVSLYFAVL